MGEGNIGIHSQKRQRYWCKVCKKPFSARAGTPFYRRRTDEETITRVVTTLGSASFQHFMERAEAGAAVRRLVHDTQSAAAFQRQRLTGVVARYRGLELVVQAHAVFAADLSLALPDGATLDAVNASTDTGIWQSVGRIVSEIPATLRRLAERIAQAQERIATIDRELVLWSYGTASRPTMQR